MNAQDLSHKPVEAAVAAEPWKAKRQMSEELQRQADEFVKRGGKIELVPNKTPEQIIGDIKSPLYNNIQPENFARSQKNAAKQKHHNLLNKELARENGRKSFAGVKCLKCGTYERWTKNSSCMVCKPNDPDLKKKPDRTKAADAKRNASLTGLHTYQGRECTRCGNTEREVESSYCVKCKR